MLFGFLSSSRFKLVCYFLPDDRGPPMHSDSTPCLSGHNSSTTRTIVCLLQAFSNHPGTELPAVAAPSPSKGPDTQALKWLLKWLNWICSRMSGQSYCQVCWCMDSADNVFIDCAKSGGVGGWSRNF